MPSERNVLRILLSAAAIFYLIFIWRTAFQVEGTAYFTLVDDAMISMRYARNLADGNGLVWNPGQAPVQGYTNLGWTLVLALVHLFPLSPAHVSLAVMLLAALILLGSAVVVFQTVLALEPAARMAAVMAATVSLFYFPLVFWTLRGLEVGALVLLLGLALLLAVRLARGLSHTPGNDSMWLALALAAAISVRLDAVLPALLILAYLSSKKPRHVLLPGLVSLMVLAAILLFQDSTYGDFLPNTYYLKVSGVSTWERVRTGLLNLVTYSWRDVSLPLFVGLAGLSAYRQLRTRESLLLLGIFTAQVLYSVWVGGDYAEELVDSANRFITQGMPALLVLFSLAAERFIRSAAESREADPGPQAGRAALGSAVLVGLAAVLVMSGEPWVRWGLVNSPMLRTDIQRARIGLHIAKYTDPEAVIAVHAAGQIPYFSQRTTIDLLGKSDPVIARGLPATGFAPGHNKWDYEYSILQLQPDVIADNFNKLHDFMQGQALYIRLPNGIYVRQDTTLVDVEGLSLDYR